MASLSHRHIYSASTAFGDSLGSSYGGFGSGDAMPRYDTGAGEHTPSFLSETARLLSSERRETYGPSSAYLYSTPPPSSQIAGWDSSLSSRLQLSSTGFKRPNEEALYPSDILSKRPRVDSISNIPAYPQRPGEKECLFYMKTRTCSFGENCKFDHPTWVPAGGIPDWKEVSVLTLTNDSLPVRPGEPECMFYMKTGACKFGLRCKFHHPKNRSSTGTAKGETEQNGTLSTDTSTKTEAPKSGQAVDGGIVDETKNAPPKPVSSYNSKGLPIRLGEAECAFYLKTGSCKFGSTCRFTHPENNPVTALRAQQLLPLLGGLSGIAGNPVTLPGVNAALADYGVGLSGIRIPGAAVQSLSLPTYPQRPGEKECVFYMKTGNCKFGLECKFHHPLSRVNPSYVDPGVKLSLAGLPRREGEAACAYYMKTGACKYGSNCRYDHPPPGEAAAKALTEASKTGQENPSDN